MSDLNGTLFGSHLQPGSNLVGACGLYCGSCGIYLATQENDIDKLLHYAVVLEQTLPETCCDGCGSDRKSAHCSHQCLFVACTQRQGVAFCGQCDRFLCREFSAFQSAMPHRFGMEKSQNFLVEQGIEQWLAYQNDQFTCRNCNTVNSAYDLACRKCGVTPSCPYVLRHREAIEKHLRDE